MRFAALLERLPGGTWRAWVPALPEVHVEASTATAAEEDLARALESYVRDRWAAGTLVAPPEIRAFAVEIRRRTGAPPPAPGEEERRRTLARLDVLLEPGVSLPQGVLDAVFRYRRELVDAADDGPPPEEPEDGLPPNVLLFPRAG